MKTIALCNQKGGVGKTTTAAALGYGLRNKDYRVLIVDADPQANLSFSAGCDLINAEHTLYDVFLKECDVREALQKTAAGVDVLTVGIAGSSADMTFAGSLGREYMLREALKPISGNYDYCVIDCPPQLGVLSMNGLSAADCVIVPLQADAYSLQGVAQLQGFIENVKIYTNNDLKVSGLLITRYKERQNITGVLMGTIEQAAESLDSVVYDTKIRESVAVRETQLVKGDLYTDAAKASATLDYISFVDEFLRRED